MTAEPPVGTPHLNPETSVENALAPVHGELSTVADVSGEEEVILDTTVNGEVAALEVQ